MSKSGDSAGGDQCPGKPQADGAGAWNATPEELAAKFTERQAKTDCARRSERRAGAGSRQAGDDIDLAEVPLLTHYDVNAAPYVTAGIVVAAGSRHWRS